MWFVNEKGKPDDRWELSIINGKSSEAKQLSRSYGWPCEDKIIVWSCGGTMELKLNERLAAAMRLAAQEYASELNGSLTRTDSNIAVQTMISDMIKDQGVMTTTYERPSNEN